MMSEGDSATCKRNELRQYPRVLIVHLSCINKADQNTMSLRNWFAEWPRDRLAQIYSGNERGEERFCGHTFKLGAEERRLGHLFFMLKRSALGEAMSPLVLDGQSSSALGRANRARLVLHKVSCLLVDSGLWEILFAPVVSPRLSAWIADFRPEVIYCQGYDLTFTVLPIMLAHRFGLPICFHTTDDWPSSLYRTSVIARVMRPQVTKAASRLIQASIVRFAFGQLMATEYAHRYGVPFESILIGDNLSRFRAARPTRVAQPGQVSIVYSGGFGHGRWKSLVDLSQAIDYLERSTDLRLQVTAFTSSIPQEAASALCDLPHVQILPPVAHEAVPSVLKGADILFLPETLDPCEAANIHLSISTKAHLYMMSERPVLVYGSPEAGVVEYAQREGWAYVVDERRIERLAQALRDLATQPDLCLRLVQAGLEVAANNHEGRVVRRKFQQGLMSAACSYHRIAPP